VKECKLDHLPETRSLSARLQCLKKTVKPQFGQIRLLQIADALRQSALQVDIPVGGTIQGYGVKFNPPGHTMSGQNERSVAVVMQYENAKAKVIWPSAIAGGPPVFPLPAGHTYAAR
jgi:hypothetical protein